jgi:hypothetical protein
MHPRDTEFRMQLRGQLLTLGQGIAGWFQPNANEKLRPRLLVGSGHRLLEAQQRAIAPTQEWLKIYVDCLSMAVWNTLPDGPGSSYQIADTNGKLLNCRAITILLPAILLLAGALKRSLSS